MCRGAVRAARSSSVAPFGLSVVFLNVLLEQLGLPVPAIPTLIVAGALAADGQLPGAGVCALAVGACLIGDSAWYLAGRLYGVRVMKFLCRISLTPDICVSQTQTSFERWGANALRRRQVRPGPVDDRTTACRGDAHELRALCGLQRRGRLLVGRDSAARGSFAQAADHAAAAAPGGRRRRGARDSAVLLGAYVAFKWWERRRFYAALDMARISVDELHAQMSGGAAPVIVDVRSPTAQGLELRRIPGALHVPVHEVELHMGELPRDREIILYCNCPNEASAAQAARVLLNHGFRRVRPLRGGLDAWIAAGYAVEEIAAVSADPAARSSRAPAPSRAGIGRATDPGHGSAPQRRQSA